MGLFRIFLIVFFSTILTACGGGGGGSSPVTSGFVGASVSLDALPDGAGAKYVGKTTAAPINQQTATDIVQILFFDSSFVQNNVQLKNADVNHQSNKLSITLNLFNKLSKYANNTFEEEYFKETIADSANRTINETDNGLISGSVIMSGDVSENGLGTVTLDWNNYDDGDGYVVNGKSSLQVVGLDYDYQVITDVIQTYDGLKIIYKGVDSFLYGEIRQHSERTGVITQIVNADSYDSSSELWKSYDNVKYTFYSQSNEYSVQGRFYRSDIGYINVSTQNRLKDCDFCTPKRPISGGPLEISDEQGSSILIRPVNEDRVRIEVANNETTEFSQNIYGWNNLDGEPLSNAAPQVSLSLSPYSPTTSENVIATITISDPDLDETTSSIEWLVNGEVVDGQNSSVLASSNFDSGDLIKITVNISDGKSTTTRSDTVNIVNRYPVAEAGSTQVLNIGDKIFLDGSNSYDPDGQEITYKWESGSDAVIIVSPDEPLTEVIISRTGNFTITLKVNDGRVTDYDFVTIEYKSDDLFAESHIIDNLGQINLEALKAEDVTGDGKKDLIYITAYDSDYKPGHIAVIKQLDDGSLADPVYYGGTTAFGSIRNSLEITDMNNDGLNDIIVLHYGEISYFEQNVSGTLEYVGSFSVNSIYYVGMIRIGDMNNDGLKDVVCLLQNTNSLEILIQNDDGTFSGSESSTYNTLGGSIISKVQVFDATGDGLEDVVIMYSSGSDDIYILPQTPLGTLGEAIVYDLAYSISSFTYGDFDNDGLYDIAVMYESGRGIGILYQTQEHSFADPVSINVGGNSSQSIKSGDINNDGLSDIVIFNYNGVNIYLQKTEGRLQVGQSFDFVYDYYNDNSDEVKVIADINSDGFLDIIASDNNYSDDFIRIMFGH